MYRLLSSLFVCLLLSTACSAASLSETQLAARVDALLAARWKKDRIVAAPLTDDAAFLRRVFLDLAGRIPSILEVRDFLDDDRPDKRRLWVDLLLQGIRKSARDPHDSYSTHFARVWGEIIVPPDGNEQAPYHAALFQRWLAQQLRDNTRYDAIVRRVLSGAEREHGMSFFEAHDNVPESLAGAATRLFLGVRLECAQCHDDRSGGKWAREQFWEVAAFFAPEGRIEVAGKKQKSSARFLDGKSPPALTALPAALANWVTAADNPWFARAAVNRVWGYLFGTGLVEPVDEFGEHNPPSHADILDLLTQQFVAHKFDLKYLLRALVLTEAYQRVSLTTHPSQETPQTFARMTVRGLSAAQLFDSLAEAMEYQTERGGPNRFADQSRPLSPRDEFLARFSGPERSVETPTSILQALHLMNGGLAAQAVSLEHNRTLKTIADAANLSTARRLETLFLVALSRQPTTKELAKLSPYVDKGGPSGDRGKALADVLWALLNSAAFRLNH